MTAAISAANGADGGSLARNPLFAFLDRQSGLLSPEQEQQLARSARGGCVRSRNQLVERNLRLVVDLARRSGCRDENDLLDRIQAGAAGLVRAAEKFDPDKGFRFSTYATWWVRQAISRERDTEHHTGVPTKLANDLRSAERIITDRTGRAPSTQALAEEAGVTVEIAAQALASMRPRSLDVHLSDTSDATLGDLVADTDALDPAEIVEQMDLREQVEQHLRTLDPPSRRAVRLRYGLETGSPETISSIAQRMRLDPVEARRLTQRAMRTLQNRVNPTLPPRVDELEWPDNCRNIARTGHNLLAQALTQQHLQQAVIA